MFYEILIRMKNNTNKPENENGLVHLIEMGSSFELKKVKEMVTFITPFVWYCNVIEHWNRIFFQGSLWFNILEVKAYHLEQLSCIVKIIL